MHYETRCTSPSHRPPAAVRTASEVGPRSQEQALLRVLVAAQLTSLIAPYADAQHLRVERDITIGCKSCGSYTPDLVLSPPPPNGQFGREPLVTVDLRLPGDPVIARFDFYTAHGVEEALIADPTDRSLLCYGLGVPVHAQARSAALGLDLGQIATLISWPESD